MRDIISLSELRKTLGVSRQTMWRWINKGCNGRKLEAFQLGRDWYTTHDALEAFKVHPQQIPQLVSKPVALTDWEKQLRERHGFYRKEP